MVPKKEQDHGIKTKIFSQSISILRSTNLKATTWKVLETANMKQHTEFQTHIRNLEKMRVILNTNIHDLIPRIFKTNSSITIIIAQHHGAVLTYRKRVEPL